MESCLTQDVSLVLKTSGALKGPGVRFHQLSANLGENMRTDLLCVIDRSGSMAWGWEESKNNFIKMVEEQKRLPGELYLTIAFFDQEYIKVRENCSAELVNIEKLFNDFEPRGSTALNDAIAETVLNYKGNADTVVTFIVTDGGENASTKYNTEQVNKIKKSMEDEKDWKFVMLGSNKAQLHTYNIQPKYGVVYDKTDHFTINTSYASAFNSLTSARLGE